ncbi:MAG TPA: hypothetical protein DDZ51_15265 [Planctomycetaceae bacterium]|nr:hypothetical protein [Planctomycetaceae bacterium]
MDLVWVSGDWGCSAFGLASSKANTDLAGTIAAIAIANDRATVDSRLGNRLMFERCLSAIAKQPDSQV